jgi:hypothetical protein
MERDIAKRKAMTTMADPAVFKTPAKIAKMYEMMMS